MAWSGRGKKWDYAWELTTTELHFTYDAQLLNPDLEGFGLDPALVGTKGDRNCMKWTEFANTILVRLNQEDKFIMAGIETYRDKFDNRCLLENFQRIGTNYRRVCPRPTPAEIAAAAAVRAARDDVLSQLEEDRAALRQNISRLRDQLREVTNQNERLANEAENVDAILKKKAADGLMKSEDGLKMVYNSVTATGREHAKMTAITEREQATNKQTIAMTKLIFEQADTAEEIEKYTNTVKDISAVVINGVEVSRIEHTDVSMDVDMSGVGDEDLLFPNKSVDERIVTLTTQQKETIDTLTTKHNEIIDTLTTQHEEETANLTTGHERIVTQLNGTINNLTTKHNGTIVSLTTQHEEKTATLKTNHEKYVSKMNDTLQSQRVVLTKQFTTQIQGLEQEKLDLMLDSENKDSQIIALEREKQMAINNRNRAIDRENEANDRIVENHSTWITQFAENHNELQEEKKARLELEGQMRVRNRELEQVEKVRRDEWYFKGAGILSFIVAIVATVYGYFK